MAMRLAYASSPDAAVMAARLAYASSPVLIARRRAYASSPVSTIARGGVLSLSFSRDGLRA